MVQGERVAHRAPPGGTHRLTGGEPLQRRDSLVGPNQNIRRDVKTTKFSNVTLFYLNAQHLVSLQLFAIRVSDISRKQPRVARIKTWYAPTYLPLHGLAHVSAFNSNHRHHRPTNSALSRSSSGSRPSSSERAIRTRPAGSGSPTSIATRIRASLGILRSSHTWHWQKMSLLPKCALA